MQRLLRLAGYLALLVTPAALLARALVAPTEFSIATLGLGGGITLVGGVTAAAEHHTFDRLEGPSLDHRDVLEVLAVAVAAGVTYVLSVHAGFGPVVASAVVGVVAGVALPDVDTAAFCGSFVGMASPAVFPSVELVLVAGLIAGLAFVAAEGTFAGFGGKLGTLALFGCLNTGLLTGATYATGSVLAWDSTMLVVPVAVVGAVVTVVLSIRLDLGAVLGSALVGLVAGVVLPILLPGIGGLLATVAYCASFVGMSSTERLGSEMQIGVAGALCGIVFVAVDPAFVGAGGKLGTTAFISCLVLFGVSELHEPSSRPIGV